MQSGEAQREALGWSAWQADAWHAHELRESHVPARVVQPDRLGYWLDTGTRRLRGTSAGRLKHRAAEAVDLPVIGDWVLVSEGNHPAVIDDILVRKTVLVRRRVGNAAVAQPLAANVDVALIVVGLDRELNQGLIKRAVLAAHSASVEPIVVLNKLDLCADWASRAEELRALMPALSVLAVSAQTGSVDGLYEVIGASRTGVLMGASGVGKSSLLNRLLGSEAMKTGEVREDDRKGYHTTTHRQLFALPGGALLIDGPGVRELGVWGPSDAVEQAFPELMDAAQRCIHRACRHGDEPGCAVRHEVRSGRMPAERLTEFHKLREELENAKKPRRGHKHSRRSRG